MTESAVKTAREKRQENLDRLYDLRDDLQTIARSDAEYARYAQNALATLRREGYDVDTPDCGSVESEPEPEAWDSAAPFCPSCGESVDAGDAFCRHCGGDLGGQDG